MTKYSYSKVANLKDGAKYYLKRKLGFNMPLRYKIGVVLPSLLIFLITALIVFILVFIMSMRNAIDSAIALLGSGSLSSSEYVPSYLLPDGAEQDEVYHNEGIIYSENKNSIVYLKKVDKSYFEGARKDGLNLVQSTDSGKNEIYLSSTLARELEVSLGDRMTLLLYEEDKNRTRPVLLTCTGIFDTGYAQLDRYMAFVPSSTFEGGRKEVEILLPDNGKTDEVEKLLLSNGYYVTSYKTNYASLYINVQQSIGILYVILVAVAFLSAFFSSDIAQIYISRDRSDIATLSLMGMKNRELRKIYTTMTLSVLFIAALFGVVLGLVLGSMTPFIVRMVSRFNPLLMDNYITSFSVVLPALEIVVMLGAMLLLSYITLTLYLRHLGKEDIYKLVMNE